MNHQVMVRISGSDPVSQSTTRHVAWTTRLFQIGAPDPLTIALPDDARGALATIALIRVALSELEREARADLDEIRSVTA